MLIQRLQQPAGVSTDFFALTAKIVADLTFPVPILVNNQYVVDPVTIHHMRCAIKTTGVNGLAACV
jgi:hypothetical protein